MDLEGAEPPPEFVVARRAYGDGKTDFIRAALGRAAAWHQRQRQRAERAR